MKGSNYRPPRGRCKFSATKPVNGVLGVLGVLLASSLLSSAPVLAQAAAPASGERPSVNPDQEAPRPNILLLMLDDVGFAQLDCFGGLIETPNIDRVAAKGVRYSNYHATPVCSASRAALLTGRNSHTVHMGGHPIFQSDAPGYDGKIPASAGTIAENLRQGGYATFALGKWDHLPVRETSPAGPQTYWPLGQGFDHFYGFLASEMDNFHPLLVRDNTPVDAPQNKNYILNRDLADQAIGMIRSRDAQAYRRPFFMYLATGTAHAPHHASQRWIDHYRGRFDEGWDKIRERILQRQIAQGLFPPSTKIGPRPEGMQPWDSLSADEKKLFARQMEVFAAALSEADEQFGRVLDELEVRGELENTVVLVTSDNGASAEGALAGSYNELFFARGSQPTAEENLKYYDLWGGAQTYPHYAFGWAVAGNTPFRYYKQTTYEGGTRVPLIVSVPHAAATGKWANSFVHISDVLPTMLDLVGVPAAKMVNNTVQSGFDGMSFAATLRAPDRASPHKDQYFEMFGFRAFWSNGWKIVSPSRLNTWNIMAPAKLDEPWQLYNLRNDPGETVDLASANPKIVERLKRGFDAQARQYNVYPIVGQYQSFGVQARKDAADFARRQGQWTYPGPVSRVPKMIAPPIDQRSFTATVDLTLPTGHETGPIFVWGGRLGGMSFYLKDGRPRLFMLGLDGSSQQVSAPRAIARGQQTLTLRVERAAQGSGKTVTISDNGQVLVSSVIDFDIPPVVPETFDVGRDDGTSVSADYAPNTNFPGEIKNLLFKF
jgi:arylsulfatase